MSPASYFRFFDLPGELRANILSNVLISSTGIVLHDRTLFGPTPTAHGGVTALRVFLVSIQMYQEASAIFYGQNCFILNGLSHRLPRHLTRTGGFLSSQGQDARRRVRTLYLYLTRVGGEFETILAPSISDMILSGRLRRLKICLGPPSSHNSRRSGPDVDMMARTPFQALLTLLADPDLQHVELCVWNVHWALFCPFHKKTEDKKTKASTEGEADTEEKTTREAVDHHGLATITGGPGLNDWIQLDWKRMVDVLATGERILKIKEADD
ncbi:hypothetical protein F5Y10DRAFT_35325 [Nemania abortiva]|nr:hypothetical protein F5Y10DRAFT_35325 [Nemania abortiva]